MSKPENIQPMTEERYQELICYTAMGGATVILDQYADHPETVERDIIRDYEDMMAEITRLTTENNLLKRNLFLAEETIKGEADDIELWKERATALYEFVVGSDALADMAPDNDSTSGYTGVFNRAEETINEMIEIRKEEHRAQALTALAALEAQS